VYLPAANEMTNPENDLGMSPEDRDRLEALDGQNGGGAADDSGPGGEAIEERFDPPGPEELRNLREKAAKADENWDKYVRVVADFDNYKKRAAREKTESVRYANESLIERLLPVMDNFEAALAATNAPGAELDSVKQGVTMIHSQLKNFLGDSGVEEIDASGQVFDPNFHEAVSQQPSTEVAEGHVLQQMRKGYKLRDRLIRPAMVVVAKKP
jgi:molecular chaperone GrpE